MIGTIWEAAVVATHLARFAIKGERDMAMFERWRALHCRTNGISTDLLNALLRLTERRAEFGTVTGIAGTLSPEARRPILTALEKDGFYVFSHRVDPTVVERLRYYAETSESESFPVMPGRPTMAVFDPQNPASPTCWHPQKVLFAAPAVQDVIADPTLLALAGEYLATVPRVTTLALWHSSHKFNEPTGHGAQLYHFDLSQPRWLKFFLYLTDVTPDAGPHVFVRGSHKRDREGAPLRVRGIQRIPDDDIAAAYGKDRIVTICGPSGTLFAADTRAFHKGEKPRSRDRLIFQVEYSNCTYTHPVEDISAPARSSRLAETATQFPQAFTRFRVIPR